MKQLFWVDPRDNGALLVAVMRELASGDTTVAFEGDADAIESLSFPGVPDVARNLRPPFSREWGETSSFVILPLTPSTLKPIVSEILSEGKFLHRVGAIQIQATARLRKRGLSGACSES
jgi:hypothetical protein